MIALTLMCLLYRGVAGIPRGRSVAVRTPTKLRRIHDVMIVKECIALSYFTNMLFCVNCAMCYCVNVLF